MYMNCSYLVSRNFLLHNYNSSLSLPAVLKLEVVIKLARTRTLLASSSNHACMLDACMLGASFLDSQDSRFKIQKILRLAIFVEAKASSPISYVMSRYARSLD